MSESDVFVQPMAADWIDAAPGVRRRMLGHNDNLMMVEVAFEKDAVGDMHSHPHIQVSFVASGTFEMTIGERTAILKQGDSFYVPADVMHGCRALEPGVLIDSFTPHREEFL